MSYLRLLRMPYFIQLLVGSWLGRLPMAMAAIAIPLTLRKAGAGYAFVGSAVGSYAIASAVVSPILGRIVDRIGQLKVLVPTAVLCAAGFAMIAAAPGRHATVIAGALLAGALNPPLEACLRTLWPHILPGEQLEGAYAVDSAAQELVFVAGPIAVAICVALIAPVAALWAQVALVLGGVLMFAAARPARDWATTDHDPHWLGPLRDRGLVFLLVAMSGAGFAIGTLNMVVVSYCERHHVPGGAPILLTLNAFASLVGVLAYGAVKWRIPPRERALLFATGLVIGYAPLALVPAPPYMAGLMLLTGMFLAPLLATTFMLIGDLAPAGTTTEAFAWLVTLFAAGNSLGSAVVGVILDHSGIHWAATGGVAGVGATVLLLAAGYRHLTPSTPEAGAGELRTRDEVTG